MGLSPGLPPLQAALPALHPALLTWLKAADKASTGLSCQGLRG